MRYRYVIRQSGRTLRDDVRSAVKKNVLECGDPQTTAAERDVFRTHIAHSVEILSKTPGLRAELP